MKNLLNTLITVFFAVFIMFFVSPFLFALFLEQGSSSYFFSLIISVLIIGSIWSFIKGKVKEGIGLIILSIVTFFISHSYLYI